MWESPSNFGQPIVIQAVLSCRFPEFIHDKLCFYRGDCHTSDVGHWFAMTWNSMARQIPIYIFATLNRYAHNSSSFHNCQLSIFNCKLRQHRIMGQGDSARDFGTSESMENVGILDVFPIFHTARLGQKIRRSPLSPLCGVALNIRNFSAGRSR